MRRRLAWLMTAGKFLQDFAAGAAYGWLSTMHAVRRRDAMERIFILMVLGEFLGTPFLPTAYRLRLLPFVTPQILTWRRARYLWSDELEAASRHLHH